MSIDISSMTDNEVRQLLIDVRKVMTDRNLTNFEVYKSGLEEEYMQGIGRKIFDHFYNLVGDDVCPNPALKMATSMFVLCDLTLGNYAIRPSRNDKKKRTIYQNGTAVKTDGIIYGDMFKEIEEVITKYWKE